MPRVSDRVKETTTTTGTGNITLAGAATGYQTFNSAFGTNSRFYYCIAGGSEWEIGFGYLSASTTLVREQVETSSSSNNAVNFSAGSKDVFCTGAADLLEGANRGQVIAASMNLMMR